MLKWWPEYRYQRTKGCTVRLSVRRAFRYQPPPAIYGREEDFDALLAASSLGSDQARAIQAQVPAAERERARRAFRGHAGGQHDHPRGPER